jgi:DNA-directed RNA polymerase specialized sigma24 family protein
VLPWRVPPTEIHQAEPLTAAIGPGYFPSTHWSVVVAAGETDAPAVNAALGTLFRTYWRPLYLYVRRRGQSHHDAEDSIQAFFRRLLEKDVMRQASQDRGRFRCFLLGSLKNFLANEHDRATTLKRGGGETLLSFDHPDLAHCPALETAVDDGPPELAFDREWAQTVFTNAMQQLEKDFVEEGKEAQFKALAPFLSQPPGEGDYDRVAQQISVRPGLMPTLVSRLRKRFRDLVRAEIAGTVATPAEVEAEMRYLVELLTR